MTNETEIPEPTDTGSDGTQAKADVGNELVPATPLATPLAHAITGLAASNTRAFGGEVASTLIAGATSQMAVELEQTKRELASIRKSTDALRDDLADERIKSAILSERISAFQSTRHLKNVGIAIGTILMGAGIQLAQVDSAALGVGSALVGAVLVLMSWLSAPRGGDK